MPNKKFYWCPLLTADERHDKEQDWDPTSSAYVDRIVAGDPEVRDVTLTMGQAGMSGTWKLEFPNKIKVWKDNGNGTFTQIVSGATQPLITGAQTINLKIEGISLSQIKNDIELKATFTPSGGVAATDSARFSVDVDSDNGFSLPDSDGDEGLLEEDPNRPGKFIAVNADDDDNDDVPDFADGFDGGGGTAGERFTPMIVQIPQPLDLSLLKLKFVYSDADPANVSQDPGTEEWSAGPGHLRLWTKDGDESRDGASVASGGDYVGEGE